MHVSIQKNHKGSRSTCYILNHFKLLLWFLLFSASSSGQQVKFVDPFIGTMGPGNVFAGACLPHGFVKLGPDNLFNSGASGYKKNKPIVGFSHLHISGMGGPMYGNIQLMPMVGSVDVDNHISEKKDETAGPGYYAVNLTRYNIDVKLTATAHAGFHQYTFKSPEKASIVVDAAATLYGADSGWYSSKPIRSMVKYDPNNEAISGFGVFKGGRSTTKPWKVYFYLRSNKPFKGITLWQDGSKSTDGQAASGVKARAVLEFGKIPGETVDIKVGVSMISVEQAKANLTKEIPRWNFNEIKKAAEEKWNKELSKIELQGIGDQKKRILYTALYHALLAPSDWTGENPVFNYKRPYYEDYLCIWDIYRTVCPLLTLISTSQQRDILNGLLDIYRHDGWLPDGHSALQREHIQVGTDADVLFADAYVKKMIGVDFSMAYQAMRRNAEDTTFSQDTVVHAGRIGLPSYLKYHYVTSDANFKGRRMTVSRTLEYVYDDFCIYQLAPKFGSAAEIRKYKERSDWYKNMWDSRLSLMRGRYADGSWIEPFFPAKSETGPNFYEGHAYTWTYNVPHDVNGLIKLFGGRNNFVDSLTKVMEGRYEAFNEPCMLQAYQFLWAGRPDLTQFYTRKAAKENFNASDNGLPGNDDSGTTSAWLLWNQIGIFPLAGQNVYLIGSPGVPITKIHLESGKTFMISARNSSDNNIYIQSARLNGKTYGKTYLKHEDIVHGGTLELIMGPMPSPWGQNSAPPSLSN